MHTDFEILQKNRAQFACFEQLDELILVNLAYFVEKLSSFDEKLSNFDDNFSNFDDEKSHFNQNDVLLAAGDLLI